MKGSCRVRGTNLSTTALARQPTPQIKRATLAKDFEAKQTSAAAAGEVERTLGSEPPMSGNPGGVSGSASPDWTSLAGETFASKDEVGELRQAVAMKVRERHCVSRRHR